MRNVLNVPVFLSAFLLISSSLMVPFLLAAPAGESDRNIALESIQVERIVPQDGKALIQVSGGKPRIIRTGDLIGDKGRVVEIAEGRVIIEERTVTGIETVIIRVEGGKQKVERIRRVGDETGVLLRPE